MGSNSADNSKDVIVVTGFGPFGEHDVNASWESVKLLHSTGIEEDLGVQLIIKEIPVEYKYVQQNIPILWKTYNPQLVVHVGVSGAAHEVNLEQQSFNKGYTSLDICHCTPENNCCIPGAQDSLQSLLDMNRVCQDINNSGSGIFSCVSQDPGCYLCGFIYFTSLSIDRTCSAFIHVPVLNKPYTAKQLAIALGMAIKSMMLQVRENKKVKRSIDG